MRLLSSSCFKENADKQESMQLFPIAWFLFIEIVDLNLVFPTQNCPDGSCGLLCSSYALLLLFSSPNSCNLYMRTHQVSITHVHVDTSRPSCSQRDFSCAERVRGQSVTEGGLWAVLNRAGCHHLVPGLCLLAALGMVGCVCARVCLGGYLFRRMPPIWGWTAVLSSSSESFPDLNSLSSWKKKKEKAFTYFHWEDGEQSDHLASGLFCIVLFVLLIQYYAACTYFEKQKRGGGEGVRRLPRYLYYYSQMFYCQCLH